MKRILIISRDISTKKDGGTLVSLRNERLLRRAGFETERFVVPIPSMTTRLVNILFRQSYGETGALRKEFLRKITEGYDYLFFDGSIYGGFMKLAAQRGMKIIGFHHNVEAEYYRQKALQTGSLPDKLMVPYIRHCETLAVDNARAIITLNHRDSKELHRLYGKGADCVLPTSFPSKDIAALYREHVPPVAAEPFLLFVGTNFFANIEGLDRFIHKVAPHINMKVKVVGNIDEAFKDRNDIPDNVEFTGRVDSLDPYYLKASAVVAPIFTGSGLKTKTAEAIGYGKTVIGYPEAFEGIDHAEFEGACVEVETDEEFIQAIEDIDPAARYNSQAEALFHARLSDDPQLLNLETLFRHLL